MEAFRSRGRSNPARGWKARIKDEAYAKVQACPLVQRCADGGTYPRALFGGFWHFVDEFPAIVRETYEKLPGAAGDDTVRRFLKRSASILSGTLKGMENDERTHRALWIQSSSRVGLSEDQLHQWKVLSEISSLTEAIRAEEDFARRLLYFAAVEIVAEGMSRYLSQAPRFVEVMGEDGMQWFTVHSVHPADATTHEALAFKISLSIKRAAREPTDETCINSDIQRCVDWFFAGGVACAREFAHGDEGN